MNRTQSASGVYSQRETPFPWERAAIGTAA
jgi:hypothetical protein